jgi:alpha-tubulin suppressor-like RCC1 family protein
LGQLGLGIVENVGDNELPTDVDPIIFAPDYAITSIVAGASRTCALRTNGTSYCWGDNSDGGLGIALVGADPPRKATEWGLFVWNAAAWTISAGALHMCATFSNNDLRCWGINDKGQLGLADTLTLGDDESVDVVAPINLGLGRDGFANYATATAAGTRHTCALLGDGGVCCWGANESGQLGLGRVSKAPVDYIGGTPTSIPAVIAPVNVFASH